ncbi:MAG: hypothetical protein QOJ64_4204 [Acidobacteriota bacterium]|nr:hypothetical protein [Acidobacteriota bacterium]
MAGQLHEHPLAELIREISDAGLSGAVRLTRERAKVVVYFDAGDVVYAEANLRTYRLAECMRRWRALSEKQLGSIREIGSDLECGAALVKTGALDQAGLAELFARQVSEVLCHALLWTEGQWSYDPRVRLSKAMRVALKTRELLIEWARRVSHESAASRFKNSNEALSPAAGGPENFVLLPPEAFILTRVDRLTRVHELVALSGLAENETLRIVYGLALGGFLKRDDWAAALSEDEIAQGKAILEISQQAGEPEPKVDVQAAATKAASPSQKLLDEKAELDALFSRLRISTNFYQILGLVRPSTDPEVKSAYHSLAKRFHPDRFRRTVDDKVHAKIETAFATIAEAYEALKTKQSRAIYDSKLLTTRNTIADTPPPAKPSALVSEDRPKGGGADSTPPSPPASSNAGPSYSAAEYFQQGIAALNSGDALLAIGRLGEAARLEPSEARYRAHYGRALATQPRLQRSAEAEIKAAVTLDANNPAYHVMLAELYVDLGFSRRAQGELRRALAIDPGNAEAKRLLDKLS